MLEEFVDALVKGQYKVEELTVLQSKVNNKNKELIRVANKLQHKQYYIDLFKENSKIKEKMPKTMTLINCVPTRMTRIKNYVPNQKTTHVETVVLMSRK